LDGLVVRRDNAKATLVVVTDNRHSFGPFGGRTVSALEEQRTVTHCPVEIVRDCKCRHGFVSLFLNCNNYSADHVRRKGRFTDSKVRFTASRNSFCSKSTRVGKDLHHCNRPEYSQRVHKSYRKYKCQWGTALDGKRVCFAPGQRCRGRQRSDRKGSTSCFGQVVNVEKSGAVVVGFCHF
jgi:hypothetical protein